jgi:hypothetical protein
MIEKPIRSKGQIIKELKFTKYDKKVMLFLTFSILVLFIILI